MKNRLALWAAATLVVTISATSCKKDNKNTLGNNSTSATIGGQAFQSNYGTGVGIASENLINLTFAQGKNGDTSYIYLDFPDTLQIGKTYKFEEGQLWGGLAYSTPTKDYITYDIGGKGTLTITSHDKTKHNVQGSYTAVPVTTSGDEIEIVNGKFNVTYLAY